MTSRRKIVVSVLLGLTGLAASFLSPTFAFGAHSVSITWFHVFGLLAAMAYGPRYGLIAAVFGLVILQPFFSWPTNGWANLVPMFFCAVFYVWHGFAADMRRKKPAAWNHPFAAQIPFALIYAGAIFVLYPPLFAANPPFWAPKSPTHMPPHVILEVNLKTVVTMYACVLLATFLLLTPAVKRMLGLRSPAYARHNGKIFLASTGGMITVWLIWQMLDSIFVKHDFPQGMLSVSDASGTITLVVMIVTCLVGGYIVALFVEKRYAAEETLQRSESRYRTLFESANDAILLMKGGKFIQCNDVTMRIFRARRGDIINHSPLDFSPEIQPDGRLSTESAAGKIEAALQGIPQRFEWRHTYPDKGTFDAEVSLNRLEFDGEILLQAIVRDVTSRKSSEAALGHQLRLQELLMRLAAKYVNLPLSEVNSATDAALGEMAEFVGADRANIFSYDFQRQIASAAHEWFAEGYVSMGADLQNIPLASVADFDIAAHKRGEPIWIPDTSQLPEGHLKNLYKRAGTKTFLAVPLMHGEECLGFVNFGWIKKHHAYASDEQRLLTVFAHLIVNIQQRRRTEETLRESELKLRTIIECSRDAIGVSKRGIHLFCNPAYLKMFGYESNEQILGKPIFDHCAPSHREKLRAVIESRARGEAAPNFYEMRGIRTDGVEFDVEINAGTYELNGETYTLATIRDISERKRADALMIESEKLRTVAGLAAGVAHEINNPMAAMVQNAQVAQSRLNADQPANRLAAEKHGVSFDALQGYLAEREIPETLEAIRDSGRQVSRIVRNLLTYSRRDSARAVINLSELVDQTLELASSDYDLKRQNFLAAVEIERQFSAEPVVAYAHATQIQQVIINLVRNAAQAMAANPPERKPRLRLRTFNQDGRGCLVIEDNGPGIAPEIRGKVFEPFVTTKPQGEGTGLGLFVSYHIVTVTHGGSMRVEAASEGGARFTIALPVAKVAAIS